MKAVLILSGKGGVGKTLISVNLALNLLEKGEKVGLLDADFSASNSGYFLDLKQEEHQMQIGAETFVPAKFKGLEIFSSSLLYGDVAISMAGDQYGQLLRDAVINTKWDVEYLIVDLPAGWHNEWKEAAIQFADNLLGSIIVLQPAHELDGVKAIELHKDLEMPILGLIENMSYFQSGAVKYKIYGESVIDRLSEEYKVPAFGKIPLSMKIRKQVEAKDPRLTGAFAEPIENACKAILTAEPKKAGFLQRLKEMVSEQMAKLVIGLTTTIDKEIRIPEIQQKFGYPGGSIIRMNIRKVINGQMDTTVKGILTQVDWMIDGGRLVALEGESLQKKDFVPDAQIDIIPKAVKWSLLKNHMLSHGYIYTFNDALRLGHMKIFGPASMAKGAFFMKNVLTTLSQNENAMKLMRPLLEVL